MQTPPITSMYYRLKSAGIKTVRTPEGVFLEYQGRKVLRPVVSSCEWTVMRVFGIEI